MQKPSNAQGTRDFGPEVMRKRDFILQSIRKVFFSSGLLTLKDLVLGEQENGKIGEIINDLAE